VILRLIHGLIRSVANIGLSAALILGVAPVRADDTVPLPPRAASLDNPLAAHSLGELTATRDRPLFTPGRRPPASSTSAHVEAPPPAPPPAPNVAFYGTLVDSEGASAIVRGRPSEKVIHVRVGDQIDGWKITQIDDRRLVLSLDARSVTFTMFNNGHAGEHAAAASPPIVEASAGSKEQARGVHGRQH
jgi:hypothetical protein